MTTSSDPCDDTSPLLTPGRFIRCPSTPGWGVGQVQSVSKGRLTANFEHAGKQTLKLGEIDIEPIFE